MARALAAVLFALIAWCGSVARAADAPENERVVALPPFMVEEAGQGPPWRYAQLPGFEVLARCPDGSARAVVQAYFKLHQLLSVVLPPELRLRLSEPLAVILYSEDLQPAASKEVFAELLRTEEKKQQHFEPDFSGRFRASTPPRVSFLPNLRLNDVDSVYVFTIVRPEDLNTETLFLTADYIAFMLRHRVPTLPTWFVAGFLAAYREMTFRDGEITLKPLQWISEPQTAAVKKDPKTATAPLPLASFFRGETVRGEVINPQAFQLWSSEASLLVRWCLDEQHPERREALWKFVDRASKSSSSEKLFTECFDFDFAAAQKQLAEFLPIAVRRTVRYQLDPAIKPEPVNFHDATPGEVARLKGDWERLEVGYVREHFPDLAAKYLAQANRTLLHGYERDARDPRLLAALGLCACDAHDDASARTYLEAAAASGTMRPRAWLELARLRYAEEHAHPASEGGKLNANQAAKVFSPLFTARQMQPALAGVYELIATTWRESAFPPTRAHLGVLDEGIVCFPHDAELVYQTAALYLARGLTSEARTYADLGVQISTDAGTRARFTALQTQLDAAK